MKKQLTHSEQRLIEQLPQPPTVSTIQSTNVWIVEWLSPQEVRTGQMLHAWIQARRPGWSVYRSCVSKAEVIGAIGEATALALSSPMVPVLHLETHGGPHGLVPSGDSSEFLTWNELTTPLQELNFATRCNLVVVVAACSGYAAIQALNRGPIAPVVAIVGPDSTAQSSDLLWGAKEIYRRWQDKDARLGEITASASREAGAFSFEWEPFAGFAYEALVELLVVKTARSERLLSSPNSLGRIQQVWDTMFMIDAYPENQNRFGVDWSELGEIILKSRS